MTRNTNEGGSVDFYCESNRSQDSSEELSDVKIGPVIGYKINKRKLYYRPQKINLRVRGR